LANQIAGTTLRDVCYPVRAAILFLSRGCGILFRLGIFPELLEPLFFGLLLFLVQLFLTFFVLIVCFCQGVILF